MKLIKTVDAEGTVLCHDITQIIKGVTKDAVFRKGHIVTKEDIPVLLSVGKDQLYVWEKQEGILHENEAAEILCRMCRGDHMSRSEAKEGKIELKAECPGLLKVNSRGLKAVNSFGQMMIATRHGGFAVKKGDKLAGTRIIPLRRCWPLRRPAWRRRAGSLSWSSVPLLTRRWGSSLPAMKSFTAGSRTPSRL